MTRVRTTIFGMAKEAREGLEAPITAADTYETRSYPNINPNIGEIEDDKAGGTLTKSPTVAGRRAGTLTVPISCAARNPGTSKPVWSLLLETAMRYQAGKAIRIAPTFDAGTVIAHNAVVTGSSSGATGRVVGPVNQGTPYAFVEVLTGAFVDADTLDDGSNAVDVLTTGSGHVTDAFAYEPWDAVTATVAVQTVNSGSIAAGNFLVGQTTGARGVAFAALSAPGTLVFEQWLGSPVFGDGETVLAFDGVGGSQTASVTLASSANQQLRDLATLSVLTHLPGQEKKLTGVRCNFTLDVNNGGPAIWTFTGEGGLLRPEEVVPLAGPAVLGQQPPNVMGATHRIDGVDVPCLQNLQIQSTSELPLRECQQSSSGYEGTLQVDRTFGGSIDPEAVSEGIIPILGQAWDKTPFLYEGWWGSVPRSRFFFRAPQAQFGNVQSADRSGIATHQAPLAFRGSVRDEFFFYVY